MEASTGGAMMPPMLRLATVEAAEQAPMTPQSHQHHCWPRWMQRSKPWN
jgi:hypothetical protein